MIYPYIVKFIDDQKYYEFSSAEEAEKFFETRNDVGSSESSMHGCCDILSFEGIIYRTKHRKSPL